MARWRPMPRTLPSFRWRCRITAIPTAMSPPAISGSGGLNLKPELRQGRIQMRTRLFGGSGIVAHGGRVAQIADVGKAFGQGIKARHHQPAQAGEELRRAVIARLDLAAIGDVVEHRAMLCLAAGGEILAEARHAFRIQPDQAAQNQAAIALLLRIGGADPFIQECIDRQAGSRWGMRIGRQHQPGDGAQVGALLGSKRQWPRHDRLHQVGILPIARGGDGRYVRLRPGAGRGRIRLRLRVGQCIRAGSGSRHPGQGHAATDLVHISPFFMRLAR